jgi:SAM-dependent methyltransferase
MLSSLRSSLVRAIERHLNEDNLIFDYGCGDMPYRELFSHSHYIAGDISGNPHADIIIEPDGKVPCEDGKFDVVLSSQVLEHVPNVKNYLMEANRLLKTGGLLFLSTHGWWTHHPYPQDLWRWTHEGLVKILSENGFNVIDSDWLIGMLAYSCQLRVQCWKGVLEHRRAPADVIFRIISFCYQQLMRFADKITPDHIGCDNAAIYFLVATKCSDNDPSTLKKVAQSTD